MIELISNNRFQYQVYTGLSLLVLGFTGIIYYADRLIFQRFFGSVNPLLALPIAIILGFILLSILLYKNWFVIYNPADMRGLLVSAGLAMIFGVVIILVDIKSPFPSTINIFFPESVLFYPAVGFFVEILFHVLPLTVLMLLLNALFKGTNQPVIFWISIVVVSFLEPIYQSSDMASSSQYPVWIVLYVGLHIFLIGLCQLLVFKRYDFISMYAFRLIYYSFWHIGWGYLRLRMLF